MPRHRTLQPFHFWLAAVTLALGLCIAPPTRSIGLVIVALLHPVIIIGIMRLAMGFFGKSYCRGPENSGSIALTFDDGPDPQLTPDVLAILARHSIRATFFVVARRAEQHPALLKQIVAAGHAVACHDLDHRPTSNFRLTRRFTRDIGESREILLNILGTYPRLYRPPVGLSNPHLFGVLRKYGMTCIGWNRSGRDAGNRSLAGIRKIGGLAEEGAIVLMHDVLPRPEFKEEFLGQLEILCGDIGKRGLRGVSVEELLGFTG